MEELNFPSGWYVIASSNELTSKKPLGLKRLGLDIVLWRNSKGEIVALVDSCPHRSVKLSLGRITDNGCIVCPFHGMTFDETGVCTYVPETTRPAPGLKIKSFPAQECYGFIWLWYSADHSLPTRDPEWFSEIPKNAVPLTMSEPIDCHITRAIENQLDYAHLGVVHSRTIGRGFDPTQEPRFELNDKNIRFFLKDRKSQMESMIAFRLPNIWLNQVAPRFMISLAFVPVDSEKTILYLTSYQNLITIPVLGKILNWILNKFNSYVLNEDASVIMSHPRGPSTETGTEEKLFPSDKAIRHFRKIWARKQH
ncbi:MAG: aromatic ring-hydroxylating dioxygenase subunit alpha [Bdellovibrionales bacterium]|nr:aromatic ring-hydroxylating dioxygenase subunit alpha [Bdellovibrionales bacterium]